MHCEKITAILKDNSGSGELIGLAMVLIFIVLVLVTPVKNIGNTISTKFSDLNTNFNQQFQ